MNWPAIGVGAQILTMIVVAIAVFNALSARLTVFEQTLKAHAQAQTDHTTRTEKMFTDHAARLAKHEEIILSIVKDLQRLIGRADLEDGRRNHRG